MTKRDRPIRAHGAAHAGVMVTSNTRNRQQCLFGNGRFLLRQLRVREGGNGPGSTSLSLHMSDQGIRGAPRGRVDGLKSLLGLSSAQKQTPRTSRGVFTRSVVAAFLSSTNIRNARYPLGLPIACGMPRSPADQCARRGNGCTWPSLHPPLALQARSRHSGAPPRNHHCSE